jgi:hypothetical protein
MKALIVIHVEITMLHQIVHCCIRFVYSPMYYHCLNEWIFDIEFLFLVVFRTCAAHVAAIVLLADRQLYCLSRYI